MIWAVAVALAAEPVEVRHLEQAGVGYTVVTVHLGGDADLRLYGGPRGGTTFADADRQARAEGRVMVAATNAGMYDHDGLPVGWFVADGVEKHGIVIGSTYGNFGLQPNGVFWVDPAGKAHVTRSEDTPRDGVRLATQSGPMLVIDGDRHPAFRPSSPNLALRSGVGVSDGGDTVHLVISEGGVRFYDFATVMRDQLGCKNALFLDGNVSLVWTAGPLTSGRFGGVIAVTRPVR